MQRKWGGGRPVLALILGVGAAAADPLPTPLSDADYLPVNRAAVEVGRLLFYDPILSGNRNISCATCHHPKFATGDGVSLSLGEGGQGLGPDRRVDPANPPEQRIPRNAPALFNMGAREITVLFHDGRIEVDPTRKAGFRTPLEDEMVTGFSGILSAQTMFPVLSPDEMAGHYSENEVSRAVRQGLITGPGGAWDLIAARVAALPAYETGFADAYPETVSRGIAFADISNAVAEFMAFEWRSDTSPFDAHLRGAAPFQGAAADGLALFYGKAGCGTCHTGPLLTDHGFHAMGQPQLGPGKAARFEDHARDEGRFRVTGDADALYAFRTPSLRNVTRTGPWGHAGAFSDLRAFLSAHLDPATAIAGYDRSQAVLPDLPGASDWRILDDLAASAEIAARATLLPVSLTTSELDALLAFLTALEDPVALGGRLGIPDRVPSGLPIDR
ncbi:cytochrome c peroxidase [Fluviibacterium sp. DFM31]|uniref:Cytochrome c peroxidase n=1 Tax=Meridianimarinicoccus marinus TaxID=3231483 RepID=A0ABV3L5I5_9RHOB